MPTSPPACKLDSRLDGANVMSRVIALDGRLVTPRARHGEIGSYRSMAGNPVTLVDDDWAWTTDGDGSRAGGDDSKSNRAGYDCQALENMGIVVSWQRT